MAVKKIGYIDLPEHRGASGFDHADVHAPSDRLYVAHTGNDAIDVIDCARDRCVESMPGLAAVAGALVSEPRGLVFTSNRGENTVSVFAPGAERDGFKIAVGVKPNGLELDPAPGRLLCACDAGVLLAIDAASGRVLGDVPFSGAPDVVFLHSRSGRLYVAIGDPGVIDVVDTGTMRRKEVVPTEAGAHMLALDRKRSKVYVFLPQSHRAAVFQDLLA
jgi:DNA-binding beta-propeller fold protein YncE